MHCLLFLPLSAQVVVCEQHRFLESVPAGDYSGITWLGGDSYAVVDDKAPTAGFYRMTITLDSLSGVLQYVRADSFITKGLPTRDAEDICYVPSTQTVFICAEDDGEVLEYKLDGQPTGRRFNIPEVFRTAHCNYSLEALTYNAATHRFWLTSENTLKADGQRPDIRHKIANRLRLQSFGDDLQPAEQYWYETDLPQTRKKHGECYLGVSALAALDDGRLLVLEREFFKAPKAVGSFAHIKIYVVRPEGQTPGSLLEKELLTEFRTKMNLTNHRLANYEGLCVGPRLSDGRQVLVMVADSQHQYRGLLRDWFRTIILPAEDF
ncbi:MAG: esterase-like activity of phytase family protein [Prevotella sp.]|nr:esterase-like activity of phytase family protein [Prevotella sp.]